MSELPIVEHPLHVCANSERASLDHCDQSDTRSLVEVLAVGLEHYVSFHDLMALVRRYKKRSVSSSDPAGTHRFTDQQCSTVFIKQGTYHPDKKLVLLDHERDHYDEMKAACQCIWFLYIQQPSTVLSPEPSRAWMSRPLRLGYVEVHGIPKRAPQDPRTQSQTPSRQDAAATSILQPSSYALRSKKDTSHRTSARKERMSADGSGSGTGIVHPASSMRYNALDRCITLRYASFGGSKYSTTSANSVVMGLRLDVSPRLRLPHVVASRWMVRVYVLYQPEKEANQEGSVLTEHHAMNLQIPTLIRNRPTLRSLPYTSTSTTPSHHPHAPLFLEWLLPCPYTCVHSVRLELVDMSQAGGTLNQDSAFLLGSSVDDASEHSAEDRGVAMDSHAREGGVVDPRLDSLIWNGNPSENPQREGFVEGIPDVEESTIQSLGASLTQALLRVSNTLTGGHASNTSPASPSSLASHPHRAIGTFHLLSRCQAIGTGDPRLNNRAKARGGVFNALHNPYSTYYLSPRQFLDGSISHSLERNGSVPYLHLSDLERLVLCETWVLALKGGQLALWHEIQ